MAGYTLLYNGGNGMCYFFIGKHTPNSGFYGQTQSQACQGHGL